MWLRLTRHYATDAGSAMPVAISRRSAACCATAGNTHVSILPGALVAACAVTHAAARQFPLPYALREKGAENKEKRLRKAGHEGFCFEAGTTVPCDRSYACPPVSSGDALQESRPFGNFYKRDNICFSEHSHCCIHWFQRGKLEVPIVRKISRQQYQQAQLQALRSQVTIAGSIVVSYERTHRPKDIFTADIRNIPESL